jgi:hypothetical protein
VRRPRHVTLEALLRRELVRAEDPATAALIRDLRPVRARGYFTRAEFLRMCRWKSPRARRLWSATPAARVRAVSRRVLAARSERRRMELLTSLPGVGVPIASAILTLLDPRRYGVLDIRAWQLLVALRVATGNPRGQGFTIGQWELYLAALRRQARRLNASARAVEYTLFQCHRALQRGRLYERPAPGRRDGAAGVRSRRQEGAPGGTRRR